MKLAVLETGVPPGDLAVRFGRYPDMYRRMLGLSAPLPSYDVAAGQLPKTVELHDAYIVSGSPAGAYDPLPWIADLTAFLLDAKGRAKLIGICFGHQIMAQAFGGRVAKSDKGWGVGLHSYRVAERQPWMDETSAVAIPASHQDQVVEKPPETVVTLTSAFTPFAGLAYSDQAAISFQFHPEFDPAFAKALIEARRDSLTHPEAAQNTLDAPHDNAQVGEWIASFLNSGAMLAPRGTSR
jgi:GMP synthase-like glutamine amidotransferase